MFAVTFLVAQVGDWTDELFRLCLENPRMPLWITAAQPSVVEQTAYYDNGGYIEVCWIYAKFHLLHVYIR